MLRALLTTVLLIGSGFAGASAGDVAPTISVQPVNKTVVTTQTAVFSVVATGSPAPTYQWRKNGTNIAGATLASYTTPVAVIGDNAALFSVVVANSAGMVTSTNATLTVTVPVAPTITTQPVNKSVVVGQMVTFSVVAKGSPAPTYQWRFNGTNIAGATLATLNTTPIKVFADNAALFSVVVTNMAGSVTSANASLTVTTPVAPTITTQPVNKSVVVGQTAAFSVVAAGNPAPTYQWRKNGTNIAGATLASYTTPVTVIGDNAALFSVVVTNSAGTVTSANATLTVTTPVAPTVTTQPVNKSVVVGQTAAFSVVAAGNPAPTYQWRKNGTNIAGATLASYTTPVAAIGDNAALFSVVVTNSAGTVTSANATLTVTAPVAPTITTQPVNKSVIVGQTAAFSVVAAGNPAPTFQWRKNGTNIAGATLASYTTPVVAIGDNAALFSVVVTNSAGTVTSSNATLTVTAPVAPTITTQPVNKSVVVGQTAAFSVMAVGNPAPTYQWRKNGTNIAGAILASYTTPVAVTGDNAALFSVVVTNSAGTVTSRNATLTVTAPVAPTITTQPVNKSVVVGQPAAFSVVATGNPAPTYQWRKNGINISGATAASYTVPATVIWDNGALFSVVVANSTGTVTSANATLSVTTPVAPTITTQPTNMAVVSGQTAAFLVVATGNPAPTYQWRKNGININGATAASYTVPAAVIGDNAALFSVVVTNSVGSVTSSKASLAVMGTPNAVVMYVTAGLTGEQNGTIDGKLVSFTQQNSVVVKVVTGNQQPIRRVEVIGATGTASVGSPSTITLTNLPEGTLRLGAVVTVGSAETGVSATFTDLVTLVVDRTAPILHLKAPSSASLDPMLPDTLDGCLGAPYPSDRLHLWLNGADVSANRVSRQTHGRPLYSASSFVLGLQAEDALPCVCQAVARSSQFFAERPAVDAPNNRQFSLDLTPASGVTDGSHTATVKLTDAAGNVATVLLGYGIDRSAPSIVIGDAGINWQGVSFTGAWTYGLKPPVADPLGQERWVTKSQLDVVSAGSDTSAAWIALAGGWQPLVETGTGQWLLPQSVPLPVRQAVTCTFRAQDQAGNVGENLQTVRRLANIATQFSQYPMGGVPGGFIWGKMVESPEPWVRSGAVHYPYTLFSGDGWNWTFPLRLPELPGVSSTNALGHYATTGPSELSEVDVSAQGSEGLRLLSYDERESLVAAAGTYVFERSVGPFSLTTAGPLRKNGSTTLSELVNGSYNGGPYGSYWHQYQWSQATGVRVDTYEYGGPSTTYIQYNRQDTNSVNTWISTSQIEPGDGALRRAQPAIINAPPSWWNGAPNPAIQQRMRVGGKGVVAVQSLIDSGVIPGPSSTVGEHVMLETRRDAGPALSLPVAQITPAGFLEVPTIFETPADATQARAGLLRVTYDRMVYAQTTGWRWMNLMRLSPDVAATGAMTTLRLTAGFFDVPDLRNFDPSVDRVRLRTAQGVDVTLPAGTPLGNASLESTRARIVAQRLVWDPVGSTLAQTLEVDVQLGSGLAAGLYDVDINCGNVKAYPDELSQQYAGANGAHRMKEALKIIRCDVDVDSDNNDGNNAPSRSTAEEAVEVYTNDPTKAGKVFFVNNGDKDHDGIEDFADGYDLSDGRLPQEATSAGVKFVPVVVEIAGDLSPQAKVRVTYDASIPRDVQITLDNPYLLPSGTLRLWKKNGDQARNGKLVKGQGGDFIKPDTYTLAELGFAGNGGTQTWYLEAVRPITTTGALHIRVEVDPQGDGVFAGSIGPNVHPVAYEVWGRNRDDTQLARVSWLQASQLKKNDPPLADGAAISVGLVPINTTRVPSLLPQANGSTIQRGGGLGLGSLGDQHEFDAVTLWSGAVLGSCAVQAQVTALTGTAQPMGGVIIRVSTDAGAPFVALARSGAQVRVLSRTLWAGSVASQDVVGAADSLLRLERSAGVVTWRVGANTGTVTLPLTGWATLGWFVVSGDATSDGAVTLANRALTFTSLPYPADALTPSNYFVHQVRVRDPRDLNDPHITIGGQRIVLHRDAGLRALVSDPFVAATAQPTGNLIPNDFPVVVFSEGTVHVQYNPEEDDIFFGAKTITEADKKVGEAIREVVEEMKSNGWTSANGSIDGGTYTANDDGAFGKEVHKRVAARFQGKPGWVAELYVDDITLKLHDRPLPPGQQGRTNLDLLSFHK